MERKISFRAWDERNKIMHNDFQFIKSGDKGNDWIIFTSDKHTFKDEIHPFENPYFQQQLKITESIGFHDCNGVEYFLGDIVQTDTIIQIIDYNESLCCYGVRQLQGGATMCIDKAWEIIGNIFENPELLN
jgi:hypothetical protein